MKCSKCKKGILQKEETYDHEQEYPYFMKTIFLYCPLCNFEEAKRTLIDRKQYKTGVSKCICIQKSSTMKCIGCKKGTLQREVTYDPAWGEHFFLKVIIWYCPKCKFKKIKTIRINREQYETGINCGCKENKTT